MRLFSKYLLGYGTPPLLLLTGCAALLPQPVQAPGPTLKVALTEAPQANLPNPASTYCAEQGHKLGSPGGWAK
ncbi:MAG: hypothetical protein WCK35_07200 [Chloroflexota bacterium]